MSSTRVHSLIQSAQFAFLSVTAIVLLYVARLNETIDNFSFQVFKSVGCCLISDHLEHSLVLRYYFWLANL